MTYQEPAVIDTINERFVPIQVNTQEESSRSVVERYRQVWTPDLRVLGSDGYEYYHWNGYLSPFEFLPQLLAGQAQATLRMNDEIGAAGLYGELLRRFPTSSLAPEAQYFLAVARYKSSHKPEDLLDGWRRVQVRYPNSIWRVKQEFIGS